MAHGGILGEALGGVLGKSIENLGAKRSDTPPSEGSNPPPAPSGTAFCAECGSELPDKARFCPGCGHPAAPQKAFPHAAAPLHPQPTADAQQTARREMYDGAVRKCPSCGSAVNPTDAVCATCGHHFTARKASGSVERFSQQMLDIERSRKDGLLEAIAHSMRGGQADSTDRQKILLINTFPIPNTIEELSEFMYLAATSIDVKLSRKSLFGSAPSTEKDISDAWVAKMQQVYQKAAMSFPNDPVFAQIRNLYEGKMAELKMKID